MIIGRDKELKELDQVLSDGKSALILIYGELQTGKSRLLKEFCQRSIEKNYRVIHQIEKPDGSKEEFTIDRNTIPDSFFKAVDMVPSKDTFLPFDAIKAKQDQDISFRTGDVTQGKSKLDTRTDKSDIQQLDRPKTDTPFSEPQREKLNIPKEDVMPKPTLILIDGYLPLPQFDEWFREFIPSLKTALPPRIIVIAASENDVKSLLPLADKTIILGSIPEQAIKADLLEINDSIQSKMSEEELEKYSKNLSSDPEKIDALTRLLHLEDKTQNKYYTSKIKEEKQ